MSNHRCNHLFGRLVEHFTGFDPRPKSLHHRRQIEPFIAGFMTGQAEKVYLGVCPACVAIPRLDDFDWCFKQCGEIAAVYKLHLRVWKHDGKGEVWFLNDTGLKLWAVLQQTLANNPDDNPAINRCRAQLCGIPLDATDPEYPWRT